MLVIERLANPQQSLFVWQSEEFTVNAETTPLNIITTTRVSTIIPKLYFWSKIIISLNCSFLLKISCFDLWFRCNTSGYIASFRKIVKLCSKIIEECDRNFAWKQTNK